MQIEYKERGIWELNDIQFPDLKLKEIPEARWHPFETSLWKEQRKKLDTQGGTFEPKYLDFVKELEVQLIEANKIIREEVYKDKKLIELWPQRLDKIDLMNGLPAWHILDCPANFKMRDHIDNREVLGVIIINLEDNPKGSGTIIGEYQAPDKKGSGLFFLNSHMTPHRIQNVSDENRYIFYSSLSIWQLNPLLYSDKWSRYLEWYRQHEES